MQTVPSTAANSSKTCPDSLTQYRNSYNSFCFSWFSSSSSQWGQLTVARTSSFLDSPPSPHTPPHSHPVLSSFRLLALFPPSNSFFSKLTHFILISFFPLSPSFTSSTWKHADQGTGKKFQKSLLPWWNKTAQQLEFSFTLPAFCSNPPISVNLAHLVAPFSTATVFSPGPATTESSHLAKLFILHAFHPLFI